MIFFKFFLTSWSLHISIAVYPGKLNYIICQYMVPILYIEDTYSRDENNNSLKFQVLYGLFSLTFTISLYIYIYIYKIQTALIFKYNIFF